MWKGVWRIQENPMEREDITETIKVDAVKVNN